jgi:streptomycin 6-kinase
MSERENPFLKAPPWGLAPWLMARLQATAELVAAEWGLELGPRIEAGRYSFVAQAGDAILKVAPAEDDMVATQPEALRRWAGDGAVRLLRHDPLRHAMLLERATPGDDASTVDPATALRAAVSVASRIWTPVKRGETFPWIGDRVPRWLDEAGDHELVRLARERFRTLALGDDDVLLHGDFHHHNIIRRGAEWVAIDPQPISGEREFDVPTLFWNPIGARMPTRESIEVVIAAFTATGLDPERMRAWGMIRGAFQGFPLGPGEREEEHPQRVTARLLL